MIILGWFLPLPLLTTIGLILIVIGAVLLVLDLGGRPIGGRRYY